MKRYKVYSGLMGDCRCDEAPDGDYVLWDDLIAAGCLVPVLVELVPNQLSSYVLWAGAVWRVWKRHMSFPNQFVLHGLCDDAANNADEADCVPVRLVLLAELESTP